MPNDQRRVDSRMDDLDDTHTSPCSRLVFPSSFSPSLSLCCSLFAFLSKSLSEKWSEPNQNPESSTLSHSHRTRRRKTRRAQEEERNGVEKIERLYSSTSRDTERGIGLLRPSLYRKRVLSRYIALTLSCEVMADEIV
jgi:hypothetical protein